MAGPDSLSSFTIYVGIPTRGFRSVQSDLARLVGTSLRLCHIRQFRQRLGTGDGAQEDVRFRPLIAGATTYSSVFGYWVDPRGAGERIDDHSEVIEFLIRPRDFAPTAMLVISEIIYPALLAARQSELLACAQHGGNFYRLSWIAGQDPLSSVPSARATGLLRAGPAADSEGGIDPVHWLEFLLEILGLLAPNRRQKVELLSSPGPQSPAEAMGPHPNSHFTRWTLHRGWEEWKLDDASLGERPWRECVTPDLGDRLLESDEGGETRSARLPIVYARILTHAVCGWLFFGASRRLLRRPAMAYRVAAGRDALWTPEVAEGLLGLLRKECERLEKYWLLDGGEEGYCNFARVGVESDDPFPNAVLWLCFVHDVLAFALWAAQDRNQEPEPARLFSPGADLLAGPEVAPVASPIDDLMLGKVGKRLGWSNIDQNRASELVGLGAAPWRVRLEHLERMHDLLYPDEHLLAAWGLYYRLVDDPGAFTLDWRTWARSPNSNVTDEPGLRTGWSARVSGRNEDQSVRWWVETARRWRAAPPAARVWLCPVMVEAIQEFLSARIASAMKRLPADSLPYRQHVDLRDRVRDFQKFRRLDLAEVGTVLGGPENEFSALKGLHEEATAGFPSF